MSRNRPAVYLIVNLTQLGFTEAEAQAAQEAADLLTIAEEARLIPPADIDRIADELGSEFYNVRRVRSARHAIA